METTPRILIVDDEPRMCQSLEVLLRQQEYDICTANTGQDALDHLSNQAFDVALLDIMLPDMTGHQLMDHINEQCPETLVIVISGNATVDSALGALRRGAYDFLRKPFEYDELLKTLQNAINQKELRYENVLINGQLALSEKRYKYLVENSPDLIYTLDEQGAFTYVNHSAEQLLGIHGDRVIGMPYTSIVYGEDLDKAQWAFNERRTGERATSGIELRLKVNGNGNGDPLHYEIMYLTVELKATGMYDKPVSEEDKRFLGTHGVARDITSRKQLEAQLHRSQRMEALGTLGGGVAHDFNNLLMGIHGNASLMLLDINSNHPHHEKLKNIEQCVQSGAELTKQLLGFARGGKYEVRPSDLNDLIMKSSEMFGRTRKEIKIERIFQEDIWTAEVDKGQIEQVLLNLYFNATQAMPGGGELCLETKNVSLGMNFCVAHQIDPGKYVRMSVTDSGVGMDETTQQRIFEPFFTTRERGRGTGLGLASAYGIIKNHSGVIDVYSEVGRGTTFTIYLPASDKEVVKEEELDQELLIGTETVLLVDDEDIIIDVGKQMLEILGYETMVARSGVEALALFKANKDKIEMVILDMIMPGMGGGETCDALKEIDQDLKVLLSSGYSLDGKAAEILERGCDGFIQKPFNMKDLSHKMRAILEKGVRQKA